MKRSKPLLTRANFFSQKNSQTVLNYSFLYTDSNAKNKHFKPFY